MGQTREQRIIKQVVGDNRQVQKQTPIATDMFLPNHSGDHSRGKVMSNPTNATDIPNKAYVDTADDLKVPYTGATADVDIGTHYFSSKYHYFNPSTGQSGFFIRGFDASTYAAIYTTSGVARYIQIFNTNASNSMGLQVEGKVSVGTYTGTLFIPTANLHIAAGSSSANTAPLKLTRSTAANLLTTPEEGALEYAGDTTDSHLYFTHYIAGVLTRTQIC